MISEQDRKRVATLREAGHGIRWIAKHLKLSRNTVREILDPKRTKERRAKRSAKSSTAQPSASTLLSPYHERIDQLLEEEAALSETKRRAQALTTTHILKDLRQLGYQGGRTILDDYLRTRRAPRRRSRKVYRRFETAPAEECQQDWSP